MTEKECKEMIYEKSGSVKTLEQFTELLNEIKSQEWNYDSLVYSASAIMRSALSVADLGLSTFQAGFVAWELIGYLMHIKSPAKIIDFNEMLYPQYEAKFQKTISADVWDYLQNKANEYLDNNTTALTEVIEHWRKIKSGMIPFGYTIS